MSKDPSPQNSESNNRTTPKRPMLDAARSHSLCLPNQPLHIPIPPSLLKSPYLNSPESIFQRIVSTPRFPSEEDEQWLQDTVPLPREMQKEKDQMRMRGNSHAGAMSGRDREGHHAPSSPPLVRWRPSVPPQPAMLGHTKSRSDPVVPRLADQGYFQSGPVR
ncbi:hypothetical protein BD779DRAFT_1670291 [Infundibulicybe gibba]|nr:hypothetical protein BD779DRAFT_1670291 [Infundibulicybe gibba]